MNHTPSISRRRFVASAATASAALVTPASDAAPKATSKKGWAGGSVKYHGLFGAQWYYTWSPKTRPNQSIEFVPMIKGPWSLQQASAIRKMGGIHHLLGFNEPEREKQGNVSVDRAVKLWPQLEALAKTKKLHLGSPACSGQKGLKWFRAFMEKAEDQGLHMDFIAFHYYHLNASIFERTVDDLADRYDLPIWITEFNGWTGDLRANEKFLKSSLKFLDRGKHIERYAYFNPAPDNPRALVAKDGSLTRLGALYREAGT